MRRLVLIALALASLTLGGLTGVAGAATTTPGGVTSSPFSLGVPQAAPTQTATTPAVVTTTSSSGNGSFSALDAIIIGAGVVLVMIAIGWFVLRDSRRTARQLGARTAVADGPRGGSRTPHRQRKLSAQEKKRRKRGRAQSRRR